MIIFIYLPLCSPESKRIYSLCQSGGIKNPPHSGKPEGADGIASQLALTSLETGILLVDHEDLTVAANNLGARLLLQRPKGLTDLHRALLSLCAIYMRLNK